MANVVYNIAKKGIMDGDIVWDTDSIRCALLMTNTTADSDPDVDNVDDITTLDECDDSGSYSRQILANAAINLDDANDRAEADADDISYASLSGDGTRDYKGVLIYKHVTNDADSIPICFVDFTSDITNAATQVDVPWDDEGILQLS